MDESRLFVLLSGSLFTCTFAFFVWIQGWLAWRDLCNLKSGFELLINEAGCLRIDKQFYL